MTKITMLAFCLMLLQGQASAQTFIDLATDGAGDNQVSSVNDMKSLEYAADIVADSLWFKLTMHDKVEGDFGAAIGLDTNLVPTDGFDWGGNNQSMKYDVGIYLARNGFFETEIQAYDRNGYAMMARVDELDTATILVSLQLSEVEQNDFFNIVAGTGSFDIISTRTVHDDIPNNTFASTVAVTGMDELRGFLNFELSPNPAQQTLAIASAEHPIQTITITTMNGVDVGTYEVDNGLRHRLDVSTLPAGLYLVSVTSVDRKTGYARLAITR